MRNLRLNPDAGHGIHMITPDGKSSLMQGPVRWTPCTCRRSSPAWPAPTRHRVVRWWSGVGGPQVGGVVRAGG
ncbi:hypothetical protein NKG94_31295 [Micromonospora sp. M12]